MIELVIERRFDPRSKREGQRGQNGCAGQLGGTESEAEESIRCGGDQGGLFGVSTHCWVSCKVGGIRRTDSETGDAN